MEKTNSLIETEKKDYTNILAHLILLSIILLYPCLSTPDNILPGKNSLKLWLPPGPPTAPVPGPSEIEGIDNGKFYLRQYLKWDDPNNDGGYNPPDSSTNTVTSRGEDHKNERGGVNFTSINLNYISINTNQMGGLDFDYIFRCQKDDRASPIVAADNSTSMSITAFLTGLILPNDKFWVNLNPWEPDRIIDNQLGSTDVGRIMLEADLQMKRDFSNYGNPCANETGKALYDLLSKKRGILVRGCMDRFPGEIENVRNIQFGAATRFWIVPDRVYAYVNGSQIYIINATLTIYSEPVSEHSYFVLANQDTNSLSKGCLEELDRSSKEYGRYAKELQDKMTLPYVVKDVNYGERYKDLRNIYISLALAQWYKSSISPQRDIFRDSLDSSNITSLKALHPRESTNIWNKYVHSYKSGEVNCWQNKTTNMDKAIVMEATLYKSGGVIFDSIADHMVLIKRVPPDVQEQIDNAINKGIVEVGKSTFFGNSMKVDLIDGVLGKDLNQMSKPSARRSVIKPIPSHLILPTKVSLAIGPGPNSGEIIHECGTCPAGYYGPDENCSCYEIHPHPHQNSSLECGTCPPGYQGPDENCSCWKWVTKMVNQPEGCGTCPSGYQGPDENCICRKEIQECGTCPSGYEGPDENCICSKTVIHPIVQLVPEPPAWECDACPAGYQGPDENCSCWKWITVYE